MSFADVLRQFVAQIHRPHEPERVVVLMDENRPWPLVFVCCALLYFLRRDFLSGACPVAIQGMGGPGAPHHYEFCRREALGATARSRLPGANF